MDNGDSYIATHTHTHTPHTFKNHITGITHSHALLIQPLLLVQTQVHFIFLVCINLHLHALLSIKIISAVVNLDVASAQPLTL